MRKFPSRNFFTSSGAYPILTCARHRYNDVLPYLLRTSPLRVRERGSTVEELSALFRPAYLRPHLQYVTKLDVGWDMAHAPVDASLTRNTTPCTPDMPAAWSRDQPVLMVLADMLKVLFPNLRRLRIGLAAENSMFWSCDSGNVAYFKDAILEPMDRIARGFGRQVVCSGCGYTDHERTHEYYACKSGYSKCGKRNEKENVFEVVINRFLYRRVVAAALMEGEDALLPEGMRLYDLVEKGQRLVPRWFWRNVGEGNGYWIVDLTTAERNDRLADLDKKGYWST